MKRFKQFISEKSVEGKNLHLSHVDDSILYSGVDGARNAIKSLLAMKHILRGSSRASHNASIKFDGAPAIFAGTDPTDGKFFVAKKGVFNKNPKVYKTNADIDADTSGDLSDKLKTALKYFPKLGIKGILQGDLMFTSKDLKKETIDDEDYITFHPNTILYAIPADSALAKKLLQAKIGVVWHTKYDGKTFETLRASFNADTSYLKDVKEVWHRDANLKDLRGSAQFTQSDTEQIDKILSDAGKIFAKISSTTLKEISSNGEIAQTLETFTNAFIRKGESLPSPEFRTDMLIQWVHDRFDKEKDKRSSEKGKEKIDAKRAEFMEFFSDHNIKNLRLLFELQTLIIEAKLMIINKLEDIKSYKTFLKTTDGFRVTKEEGYVVTDKLTNGAYKLVDRIEFSRANFDPATVKGWQR